jgi:hypothetical protein
LRYPWPRLAVDSPTDACLNCGAALTGRFCGTSGQRVLPPDPSLRELLRDAWDEFAGYDGRFARTLRILLLRPGRLTTEVLHGRRNRYISPVRLYLFASVSFFLVAALAPSMSLGGGLRAGVTGDGQDQVINLDEADLLSAEQRAAALKSLERTPWWLTAVLRPIFTDPVGFRTRLFENMPRVLFALIPVFALAIGLFFRGGWLQHVVFSLHAHAAVFLLLIPRELAKFTGSVYVLGTIAVVVLIAATIHLAVATRRVYQERWLWLLLKAIPVAIVYALAYGVAIVVAVAWTAAG